jgi:hypothetical protein
MDATVCHVKFFPLTLVLLATGCAVNSPKPDETLLVAGDASAPSQLTPAESMSIAHELATHPWRPFAGNILHGKDKNGILVNTPDVSHEPQQTRQGRWIPGSVRNV